MTAGGPGDRPLTGVTVVVTRPIDQADALADLLAGAGALPIVMPLIELVDVASADEVAAAIGPLGADDWVVVASAHAASRVRGALTSSPARVAAVGATTARSLPRTDLVAEQQSAEGLVAVFPTAGGAGGAGGAGPAGRAPMARPPWSRGCRRVAGRSPGSTPTGRGRSARPPPSNSRSCELTRWCSPAERRPNPG